MAKKKSKKAVPPTPAVSPTEPPMCSCLLLCDDVVVTHAKGGKHHLQGIIGGIGLPLPATAGNHVVYLRLTNVYPNAHVVVSFQHEADNVPVWQFRAEFVPKSQPLDVNTMIVNVPPFRLTKAGRYHLQATYQEVPIATVPIIVHDLTPAKGDGDGPDSHGN